METVFRSSPIHPLLLAYGVDETVAQMQRHLSRVAPGSQLPGKFNEAGNLDDERPIIPDPGQLFNQQLLGIEKSLRWLFRGTGCNATVHHFNLTHCVFLRCQSEQVYSGNWLRVTLNLSRPLPLQRK
jgi:hypothetical protein